MDQEYPRWYVDLVVNDLELDAHQIAILAGAGLIGYEAHQRRARFSCPVRASGMQAALDQARFLLEPALAKLGVSENVQVVRVVHERDWQRQQEKDEAERRDEAEAAEMAGWGPEP